MFHSEIRKSTPNDKRAGVAIRARTNDEAGRPRRVHHGVRRIAARPEARKMRIRMRVRWMPGMVSWLALVAIPLMAGGCMDPVDREAPRDERSTVVGADDPDDGVAERAAASGEVESSVSEAASLCCSYGYYRCPTTGAIFDYEALACSAGPRKTTAAAQCDAACAATCVDSGWINPCL